MKKIYQEPEVMVVKVETLSFLAASVEIGDGEGTFEGADSRGGRGFFDDEE